MSVDPLPSSVTVVWTDAVTSAPAFAAGAVLIVDIVTVSGALDSAASLTINCTMYSPGRSTVKVGVTVVAPTSAAALPDGRNTNAHENDNRFPSGSADNRPSRRTRVPTGTV